MSCSSIIFSKLTGDSLLPCSFVVSTKSLSFWYYNSKIIVELIVMLNSPVFFTGSCGFWVSSDINQKLIVQAVKDRVFLDLKGIDCACSLVLKYLSLEQTVSSHWYSTWLLGQLCTHSPSLSLYPELHIKHVSTRPQVQLLCSHAAHVAVLFEILKPVFLGQSLGYSVGVVQRADKSMLLIDSNVLVFLLYSLELAVPYIGN